MSLTGRRGCAQKAAFPSAIFSSYRSHQKKITNWENKCSIWTIRPTWGQRRSREKNQKFFYLEYGGTAKTLFYDVATETKYPGFYHVRDSQTAKKTDFQVLWGGLLQKAVAPSNEHDFLYASNMLLVTARIPSFPWETIVLKERCFSPTPHASSKRSSGSSLEITAEKLPSVIQEEVLPILLFYCPLNKKRLSIASYTIIQKFADFLSQPLSCNVMTSWSSFIFTKVVFQNCTIR